MAARLRRAVGVAVGTPFRLSGDRHPARTIAVHRCAARLDSVKFLEGIFLTDQAGKFGERVFPAARTRPSRSSLLRLWLGLPVALRGPVHGLFPHLLPIVPHSPRNFHTNTPRGGPFNAFLRPL